MSSITDPGRFLRLKTAIRGSLQVNAGPMSSEALGAANDRYREAILAALPEDLTEEFTTLFPARVGAAPRSGRGDLIGSASRADSERERLLAMAGWLDGLVDGPK